MAIAKMRRVHICALKQDRKAVLEKVQSMGLMEVSAVRPDESLAMMDTSASRQGFDRNVQLAEQALEVLNAYAPEKKGLLSSLTDGGSVMSQADFDRLADRRDEVMGEASDIVADSRQIAENRAAVQKLDAQIETLKPWLALDVPMDYTGSERTVLMIGTMPQGTTNESFAALLADRLPQCEAVDMHILSNDRDAVYLAVTCLKEDAQALEDVLRQAGFSRPSQPAGRTPAEETQVLQRQIDTLNAETEKIEERLKGKADWIEPIQQMSDYFRTRSEKYAVLGTLPQSDNAFFLSGYVPEEALPAFEQGLTGEFDCLVESEELGEKELGPTLLKNNKFSESVEGVLKSYSLPTRKQLDPTTIMSFFYVIFFGMMLSDAGYGIIMVIGCALLLIKGKNMKEGLRKTMKMFMFCGISTAFWGFMYGSFFGDAIDVIAQHFFGYTGDTILKPLWFEPMAQPMKLLLYCMLFGVIHLYFGLGLKGLAYLKEKDFLGWVSDVLSWYMLLTGLILMLMESDIFASIAGQQFVFPPFVGMLAKIIAIVGAVIILVMSGRRKKKKIGLRIAIGLYDLYGITGWLSDVLSYSRLLALGLATGVIASVINMMATMFGSGVLGVILFIVIFILGHTVNLGINALGAYVHTNRLQFVEFFGKFYDGGGEEFKPFTTETKYTTIKEEKR